MYEAKFSWIKTAFNSTWMKYIFNIRAQSCNFFFFHFVSISLISLISIFYDSLFALHGFSYTSQGNATHWKRIFCLFFLFHSNARSNRELHYLWTSTEADFLPRLGICCTRKRKILILAWIPNVLIINERCSISFYCRIMFKFYVPKFVNDLHSFKDVNDLNFNVHQTEINCHVIQLQLRLAHCFICVSDGWGVSRFSACRTLSTWGTRRGGLWHYLFISFYWNVKYGGAIF